MACTFDTGFCNWEQATDDKFDWTRLDKKTPSSPYTGPSSAYGGKGNLLKNCCTCMLIKKQKVYIRIGWKGK